MPGEIALKCAECSVDTRYRDIVYNDKGMVFRHKPDCSSQNSPYPRMYITQATNPSQGSD